jgi:hypothetical protein
MKTTQVPSVIKLRESVKAPAPDAVAYVKIYPSREAMPPIVRSAFTQPTTRGMTIEGRYVAIIGSEYPQEVQDILSHEMVHCYLTLSSPRRLPAWFQEGAAVYFSTGKEQKFYGREAGVPEGKNTLLPAQYRNRLFMFRYMEQKAGKEKLYQMVRKAVATGQIDPTIVGLPAHASAHPQPRPVASKKLLLVCAAGGLLIVLALVIWTAARREEDY